MELNGGAIRDGSANAAVLTLPGTTTGAVGALATNAQWVIDTTAPSVVIGSPSLTKTDSGPVTFAITYTDLNGITPRLTLSDVTLVKTGDAAGVLAVAGSGAAWTVTISNIIGDGTLAIALAAGTAVDPAGNLAPAVATSTSFLVENILPVKITAQPVAVSANQGDSVRFAVTTTGRPAASPRMPPMVSSATALTGQKPASTGASLRSCHIVAIHAPAQSASSSPMTSRLPASGGPVHAMTRRNANASATALTESRRS